MATWEKAITQNSTADLYPEVMLWIGLRKGYGSKYKYADECFGPINSYLKEYNPKLQQKVIIWD